LTKSENFTPYRETTGSQLTTGINMSNHAIVIKQAGKAELREVTVPKLRDDYINVRVRAVALNPTDWKHVDYLATPGARVGCDYAGLVEEVGKKVTKNFKKGDRVCGFSHGANKSE
jgi:NADPH:quinone reductase-like Zn-dependent oxidoreductase